MQNPEFKYSCRVGKSLAAAIWKERDLPPTLHYYRRLQINLFLVEVKVFDDKMAGQAS